MLTIFNISLIWRVLIEEILAQIVSGSGRCVTMQVAW